MASWIVVQPKTIGWCACGGGTAAAGTVAQQGVHSHASRLREAFAPRLWAEVASR